MSESTNPPGLAGTPDPPASRRRFLSLMSKAFLSLWGLGVVGVVGAFLRPRSKGELVSERIVRAGFLEELRVGEARMVRHGTTPFFIVRVDAGRVIALSAVCTHLRCILDYDRDRHDLVCPCHGGRFSLTGNAVSGPPNRALPTYDVSVRSGEILVRV